MCGAGVNCDLDMDGVILMMDEEFLKRAGIRRGIDRAELQRIDASTVTLAIQDPHLGTVRSMQEFATVERGGIVNHRHWCEFIDDIDAQETVIMDCVAIDESLRRRDWRLK